MHAQPVGAGRDRRRDPRRPHRRLAGRRRRAPTTRRSTRSRSCSTPAPTTALAMACLDVARRHALRRAHAQYGRRIADYATIAGRLRPRALRRAGVARCSPTRWPRRWTTPPTAASWDDVRARPATPAPRAAFTSWGLEAKVLAAGLASRVSDAMLQICGGRGYTRGGEIERLVRDAKAGWVMAPSNEVSRQIVGRGRCSAPTPSTGGTRRSTSARCTTSSASWTTRTSGGWSTSSRPSSPTPAT